MNVFDKHLLNLRFNVPRESPEDVLNKWNVFRKGICIDLDESLIQSWLKYCNVESNRCLNHKIDCWIKSSKCKQILLDLDDFDSDNNIYMKVCNYNSEKWTLDELDDLVTAFIKYFDNIMGYKAAFGCIELELI